MPGHFTLTREVQAAHRRAFSAAAAKRRRSVHCIGQANEEFPACCANAECKELSLKCVQENQQLSCAFIHTCTPPPAPPAKNPSTFYQEKD